MNEHWSTNRVNNSLESRQFKPSSGSDNTLIADSLYNLFQMIWRRKALLLGTVVTVTALAAMVVFQLSPRYSAKTVLMIEPRKSQVTQFQAVMEGLPARIESSNSEMEVIRSRELAEKVVDQLKLDKDPEFNTKLRDPGWREKLIDPVVIPIKKWIKSLVAGDAEVVPQTLNQNERARIIDTFLAKLEVSSIRLSYIINIKFESENPETAASVANVLADFYIVEQLEVKYQATRLAQLWLRKRVELLREKVELSERAVEDYRKKWGLLEGTQSTLASQEISELNSQLVEAKAKYAEAKARLGLIPTYMPSKDYKRSVVEVLNSLLIQNLRGQEALVARQIASLSREFGERHPKMVDARAELREIRARISDEIIKIYHGIENEARVAKERVASLKQSIESLKENIASGNRAEINLRALEREAQSNRLLLESLLSRFKQTEAQNAAGAQRNDIRIVSRAAVPLEPFFPKKSLLLSLAIFASFFVGCSIVFAKELLNRGFRSLKEVEQHMGIPGLVLVPKVSTSLRSKNPYNDILTEKGSAFTEAIRTLRTSILGYCPEKTRKYILITSAQTREGKTSIAVCLLRSLAKAGCKVLLIDADLRNPAVHEALRLPQGPGLVELLSQDAKPEDVTRRDRATGAHVITSGRITPDAPELLSSNQMTALLVDVEQSYDLVLIDSPPVAIVSDAQILAREVDQTVLVVRWSITPREVASKALRQLRNSGASQIVALLSMVDLRMVDLGFDKKTARKYFTSRSNR